MAHHLVATGILTKITYSYDRTAHGIQLQLSKQEKHQ
jgi:hypothetical protein